MFLQKPMLGAQLDHSDSLNNPVLDLLFNEGHGDVVHDLSGYGNHGTLHGFDFPPTVTSGWNPGADGVALTFDSIDDYIKCGNAANLNTLNQTICASVFVMNRGSPSTQGIITNGSTDIDRSNMYIESGKILFRVGNGDMASSVNSNAPALENVLTNVVCTKEYNTDTILKIYINGVFQNSATLSGASDISSSNVLIGWLNNDRYLNGAITRVRILTRAMSPFEVMQTQIDPYGVYLQ